MKHYGFMYVCMFAWKCVPWREAIFDTRNFIWAKLNPIVPRMLHAKIKWTPASISWEKYFQSLCLYTCRTIYTRSPWDVLLMTLGTCPFLDHHVNPPGGSREDDLIRYSKFPYCSLLLGYKRVQTLDCSKFEFPISKTFDLKVPVCANMLYVHV